MGDTGQPWSLPYPELVDLPNAPQNVQDLAKAAAAWLGFAYPCVHAARPSNVAGRIIFETDTSTYFIGDGTNWNQLAYGDDTGYLDAVAAGVSAASGFGLTSGWLRRLNGWTMMYLTMTTTAGFAAGDIANVTIATLPGGYYPTGPTGTGVFNGGANGPGVSAYIATSGQLVLCSSIAAVAAAGTFSINGTFPSN